MARQAPRPLEKDILKGCLEYLIIVRRWRAWRANTGAAVVGKRFIRFGQIGASDALAVIPPGGRLLALETKRPGNKPTPAQEVWLGEIRDAGGLAIVATSVDDLRRQLEMAGYPE